MSYNADTYKTLSVQVLLLVAAMPLFAFSQTIPPSPFWKNQIVFPDDPFRVAGGSAGEPSWVKFAILLEPYDPNIVYFQDGHEYTFHYHFATELLEPFIDILDSDPRPPGFNLARQNPADQLIPHTWSVVADMNRQSSVLLPHTYRYPAYTGA